MNKTIKPQIGDVVIVELTKTKPPKKWDGKHVGIIEKILDDVQVLVKFNDDIGGHAGDDIACANTFYWYVCSDEVTTIYRPKP